MSEVSLVSRIVTVFELSLDVIEREAVLVEDESAAVGKSADMKPSTCALLDLLTVLSDDVHESLSDHTVSGDEKVDVLTASSVEEFVVDCAYCSISVYISRPK